MLTLLHARSSCRAIYSISTSSFHLNRALFSETSFFNDTKLYQIQQISTGCNVASNDGEGGRGDDGFKSNRGTGSTARGEGRESKGGSFGSSESSRSGGEREGRGDGFNSNRNYSRFGSGNSNSSSSSSSSIREPRTGGRDREGFTGSNSRFGSTENNSTTYRDFKAGGARDGRGEREGFTNSNPRFRAGNNNYSSSGSNDNNSNRDFKAGGRENGEGSSRGSNPRFGSGNSSHTRDFRAGGARDGGREGIRDGGSRFNNYGESGAASNQRVSTTSQRYESRAGNDSGDGISGRSFGSTFKTGRGNSINKGDFSEKSASFADRREGRSSFDSFSNSTKQSATRSNTESNDSFRSASGKFAPSSQSSWQPKNANRLAEPQQTRRGGRDNFDSSNDGGGDFKRSPSWNQSEGDISQGNRSRGAPYRRANATTIDDAEEDYSGFAKSRSKKGSSYVSEEGDTVASSSGFGKRRSKTDEEEDSDSTSSNIRSFSTADRDTTITLDRRPRITPSMRALLQRNDDVIAAQNVLRDVAEEYKAQVDIIQNKPVLQANVPAVARLAKEIEGNLWIRRGLWLSKPGYFFHDGFTPAPVANKPDEEAYQNSRVDEAIDVLKSRARFDLANKLSLEHYKKRLPELETKDSFSKVVKFMLENGKEASTLRLLKQFNLTLEDFMAKPFVSAKESETEELAVNAENSLASIQVSESTLSEANKTFIPVSSEKFNKVARAFRALVPIRKPMYPELQSSANIPIAGHDQPRVGNFIAHPALYGVDHSFSLDQLFTAGVHLGHKAGAAHPTAREYVFGDRNGMHIIDLELTSVHLRRALRVIKGIAYNGGVVLFVGTRTKLAPLVRHAAMDCGEYYVTSRWLPGTLTNCVETLRSKRLPDLIIFTSMPLNAVALNEAIKCGIPSIGLTDTDCDTNLVTYPVPANDDSVSSVSLLLNLFNLAVKEGKTKRQSGFSIDNSLQN